MKNNKCSKCLQRIEPIRSENKYMIFWELLVSLMTIIIFFIIPVKIAFYSERYKNEIQVPGYRLDAVTIIIFIIITFDIILRFFRCYYELGIAITDKRKIINHYLTGLFISDILVWLFYILDLSFLGDQFPYISLIFYLRIINLSKFNIKITRILQLHRKLKGLYLLVKLIFFILFVCHVAANIFYGISVLVRMYAPYMMTWVEYITIANGNNVDLLTEPWYVQYNYSLYWSIQTMVTVGYGDVTPRNAYEIMFTSLTMIGSCLIFAYSVNSIYQIFNDIKQGDIRFERNFNAIGRFMRDKNVKQNMQLQVGAFLEFNNKERNREKDIEDQVISQLPPILRQKLIYRAYGKQFLGNIPWIKKKVASNFNLSQKEKKNLYIFSKPFLEELSFYIQEEHFTKGEVVFQQKEQLLDEDNHTDSHNLYFIYKGSFQEYIDLPIYNNGEGVELRKLYKNEHFGDYSFLTGNPRPFSVKSIDYSSVYKISRKKFIEILENYPQDNEKFCQLKDKLLFQQKYSAINWKCYFCNNTDHIATNCFKMHYSVDPEKIVKFNNQDITERDTSFNRKINFKYDFLQNILIINEAALRIQQTLIQSDEEDCNSEFDDEFSEYNQEIYSPSDYDEYDDEDNYQSQRPSTNLIRDINQDSLESPKKQKRQRKKKSSEEQLESDNNQNKKQRRNSRLSSRNDRRKSSAFQDTDKDRAEIIKKYQEKQKLQKSSSSTDQQYLIQNQQQTFLNKHQFSLIEEDELEHLYEQSQIKQNQPKKNQNIQKSSSNQQQFTRNTIDLNNFDQDQQNQKIIQDEEQQQFTSNRIRNKTISVQSYTRENSGSNINVNMNPQKSKLNNHKSFYNRYQSQNLQDNNSINLSSNQQQLPINQQELIQNLIQVLNTNQQQQNNSVNNQIQNKKKMSSEIQKNYEDYQLLNKNDNLDSIIIKEKESFDIDKIHDFKIYMKDFNPKNIVKKRYTENKKKKQQIIKLDKSQITNNFIETNNKQVQQRYSQQYNTFYDNNKVQQTQLQGRLSQQNLNKKFT